MRRMIDKRERHSQLKGQANTAQIRRLAMGEVTHPQHEKLSSDLQHPPQSQAHL